MGRLKYNTPTEKPRQLIVDAAAMQGPRTIEKPMAQLNSTRDRGAFGPDQACQIVH